MVMAIGLSAGPAVAGVIAYRTAEIAYSKSTLPPTAGWVTTRLPSVSSNQQSVRRGDNPPTLWARFRFDRAAAGPGLLALFSDRMRERYVVYLNGVDLYRSNGGRDDTTFGWHRPLFLPLPTKLLRQGTNEIDFRVESSLTRPLGIGLVTVGPDAPLRAAFRLRALLTFEGPRVIAGVVGVLSIGALLFWLVRPRERVFGWLGLVGLLWCFWDLQYFIYAVPINVALFWRLIVDVLFLLIWAMYGFALSFFEIARRGRLVLLSGVAIAGMIAVRETLLALDFSDRPSFLLVIPLSAATLYVLARACWRQPRLENLAMLGAVTLATAFGFHDFAYIGAVISGAGFQLIPYGGLLVFLVFGFALGRRVLVALAAIEDDNLTLEQRMAAATDLLSRSEAERRRLEVANAVDTERERMMREIHDGIGSSLITALAVAQRERQSANTIATLRKSIADLRIGVDSLEPINGDVVMLLASLRHRMERDLADAGLTFVWREMSAPPLPWLDATGALHILRIVQEAIGNTLKHADATELSIDCHSEPREGRRGVLVTIADNGRSGSIVAPGRGRGVTNMKARADALNAWIAFERAAGKGTKVQLWLPLD